MKKPLLSLTMGLLLFLAACSAPATASPAPLTAIPAATSTPDRCSPENLFAEAETIHALMREFDDYAILASNTPQAQLVHVIPELQRVRRAAEDVSPPGCLRNLHRLQLLHMNTVIETLVAFLSSSDAELVNAGIAQARQYHDAYDAELSAALGVTVVAPAGQSPVSTPTSRAVAVVNLGKSPINCRASASLESEVVGGLEPRQPAVTRARSQDGAWFLVELPGQAGKTAWVYADLVEVSGDASLLPVATVAP
ncbi:MAG: hypothetical protein ACOYYJ_14395 [Chloroflexota bacterium]